MRACILLNPNAGSANRDRLRACVQPYADVAVWDLPEPAAVPATVRKAVAHGARRILAAGGDGTVHQVAKALIGADVGAGLGVIPCGTGNDLACTLGMPSPWPRAVATACAAPLRRMDVLTLHDAAGRSTIAVNGVAGGFAGDVGDAVTPRMKARWGAAAFVVAVAKTLPSLTPVSVRVALDGDIVKRRVIAVLVMNGRTIGGRRLVAPQANLFDGWMDVVLVHAASLPRLLATGGRLLQAKWPDDPNVEVHRCQRLSVAAEAPLSLNVDGEPWSDRSLTATVWAGALRVAVAGGV